MAEPMIEERAPTSESHAAIAGSTAAELRTDASATAVGSRPI